MSELFTSEDLPPTGTQTGPTVLARKYRPATFDELIGQEAVVKTLTNAIDAKRLPHAWILTGVRGVGKTTTARIIARALNCTGVDGKGAETIKPCGQCEACRSIAEDRHVDVMEMDAASRTGVDDIREIIDGVRYGPVSARYKIYILDEVHMLSKNAFNALLKTLEEPPPHTKFIFATTEIRKVPITVLSRCQRFDLRRIESGELFRHFLNILIKEKVEGEEEAVKFIAHAADGSVRDGLSLLDQAIARSTGKITANDVKDMLGLSDRGESLALARFLLRGKMEEALGTYANLIKSGADPLQVLQDMAEATHLLTRGQIIKDLAARPDIAEMDRQFLTDMADVKISALTRAWQILLKGINEVQTALHPVDAAEMVLIRLAYAAELPPPSDLIRQLRDKMKDGSLSAPSSAPNTTPPTGPLAIQRGSVVALAAPMRAPIAAPAQPNCDPTPQNFLEVVALFDEHREGALLAELRANVHPIRCVAGQLAIRTEPSATADLSNRLSLCLSRWTGKQWMVSLSSDEGEATLAEKEQTAERLRFEKIEAHPLMQAVRASFEDCKITNVRQKVAAAIDVAQDAPESETPDTEEEV